MTEGIDVPAVDMVAFIDPRQSKIDIAQATGRAMRKPEGTGKTVGYVVVPVFLDAESEGNIEDEIRGSRFEELMAVLNALEEQDQDLVDIIRILREDRGRGEVFNPRALQERVEVIGDFVSLERIADSISLSIVDRIGLSWDETYGRLVMFQRAEGHCRVPAAYKTEDGYRLGTWVGKQSSARAKMAPERRQRLEGLPGWCWDARTDQWEEGFSRLKEFSEREGHGPITTADKTKDGYRLGLWVSGQRKTSDNMDPERRRRLEALPGWSWDPFDDQWEEGFSRLREFSERQGHCRVVVAYETEDGYRLGQWVGNQRAVRAKMDPERRLRLEGLPGWSWDTRVDQWEEGFFRLKEFSEREGHCRVLRDYEMEGGYGLGTWIGKQRAIGDKMDPERRQRLEELPGWSWDPHTDQWEEGFTRLREFSEREGHCRVSQTYETDGGYRLGQWVAGQRTARDKMESAHRKRLEGLPGWSWVPHTDRWEEGFSRLRQFSEREGHCRVPFGSKTEDGYRLGQWVASQRAIGDRMDPQRRRRLEELPGWLWKVGSSVSD